MMFFIGSMVIMMEIPNNYLNGWVVQVKMTKYIFPNLKDNQRDLFNIINQILSRDKLSIEERKCFLIAKKNIESGRNFDPQISELISSLQYLAHSSDVQYFFSEAQKRMLVNPGTGGSLYGWSNFESK